MRQLGGSVAIVVLVLGTELGEEADVEFEPVLELDVGPVLEVAHYVVEDSEKLLFVFLVLYAYLDFDGERVGLVALDDVADHVADGGEGRGVAFFVAEVHADQDKGNQKLLFLVVEG